MIISVFDSHSYDREALSAANKEYGFELRFLEPRLTGQTAVLARGSEVVCSFVNDEVDRATLVQLKSMGVRLVALRSAGFNHVDLVAARDLEIPVVRVPEYSPHAVAEHAFALILMLNRKLYRAYNRVRELNFTLDGLVGFDLKDKRLGVVGTGRIGTVAAQIGRGFGMDVVAFDVNPDPDKAANVGFRYCDLDQLYGTSDVITLHVPLTPQTYHMVNHQVFSKMKRGVLFINTSRGGLVHARDLIRSLKECRLGGAGLDVYEEEEGVFFQNLEEGVLQDDLLARLLTFPNVVITSHQAFLTKEALANIAVTTLENVKSFLTGKELVNEVKPG